MRIKYVNTDSSMFVGDKTTQNASLSETIHTMFTFYVKVHTSLAKKNVTTIFTKQTIVGQIIMNIHVITDYIMIKINKKAQTASSLEMNYRMVTL